ncbi:MAG: alpha-glucan family phosphorylase [Candidatus Margulisiibacteriota bacterium]
MKYIINDVRPNDNINEKEYFGFPIDPVLEAEQKLASDRTASVAYFSMEYGLAPSVYHTFKGKDPVDPRNIINSHEVFSNLQTMDSYHYLQVHKLLDMPIYSGGLGVLAGDTLKSCADLGISLVGIGILWSRGYFKQKFWFLGGGQFPEELAWDPNSYPGLVPTDKMVKVDLGKESVILKIWKYFVYSYDLKKVIPLILLDSNIPENKEYFRQLTGRLYRSDNAWWKAVQRMILGIGGIKALDALGYKIDLYHLNEGHAAFAFLERAEGLPKDELKKLEDRFAYTCHTPVEAGHDRFAMKDLKELLSDGKMKLLKELAAEGKRKETANLTLLCMAAAGHANAVAQKHGEVTRIQFPEFKEKIKSITNGVHTYTWLSDPVGALLKKYKKEIGDWENDPTLLANVAKLKADADFRKDLWQAHNENKSSLQEMLPYWMMKGEVFTMAWARRIANYKRPSLALQDPERLLHMARTIGPIQIIFAGKAHPADDLGMTHMDEMLKKIASMEGDRKYIRLIFLENYDTYFGKVLSNCVDVWLNNPLPPFEASGTSGMKAILNGVVQLSTLDGWVVEAADKGIGKIFGYVPPEGHIGTENDLRMAEDSEKLYQDLEELAKQYYKTVYDRDFNNSPWIDMMINCIATSAYFSTHRMVREYQEKIWS